MYLTNLQDYFLIDILFCPNFTECMCQSMWLTKIVINIVEIRNFVSLIPSFSKVYVFKIDNINVSGEERCGEACWGQETSWGQAQEACGSCQGIWGGHGLCLPVHQVSSGKRKYFPKENEMIFEIFLSLQIPSISPFCLKLESWLKLHGIKYQVGYTFVYLFCSQVIS